MDEILLISKEVLCYGHVIDTIEDSLVFQVSILQDINEIISLNVLAVDWLFLTLFPSLCSLVLIFSVVSQISDHEGGPPYKVSVSE